MGGLTSRTEKDLKLYLERDYDITHYPSIIHRTSKKTAIVHQITTDSTEQAHRIRTDVNLYKHIKCQSISNILEYIPLESAKICSDQEFHYIVEEDMQKYNLKEEFYARKYYKEKFSDHEILSIIKAFLCGLNVYHSEFHRSFNSLIRLEALTVDEKRSNHLRLTDPLLMTQQKITTQSLSETEDESLHKQPIYGHLVLKEDHNTIRVAPQKSEIRKTKFNEKRVDLNELLADIYLVGVLALEIYRMKPFDKTQKHSVLPSQINSISNRELNKVISTMTAFNPEDRGKVFAIIKVSPQESYHLQKNFKNGNINPRQTNPQAQTLNQNQQSLFKKENSFSFGTSPSTISPIYPAKNAEPIGSYFSFDPQKSSHLLNFEQQKNGSLSNMSTDRTTQQISTMTVRPVPQGNFKPIINFNSGGNTKNASSNSNSVTGFGTYLSNTQQTSFSLNNISSLSNSGFKAPCLLQNRTNSFLIQQDRRQIEKQIDYSPFKKQQDMSPIIAKDNLEESSFKKIFEKYSHLNFESHIPQNNFPESKKVEQQMNRLLKQSSQRATENQKNTENKKTNENHKNKNLINHAPMTKEFNRIDSPIDALEPNRSTTFTMRQNAVRSQTFNNNGQVPLYKPNKQVEEILKRLGIGSLLYGSNENNSKQQVYKVQKQESMIKREYSNDKNSDQNIFTHKGAYNIALNPNNRKQSVEQQEKIGKDKKEKFNYEEDDIPDRQTTPIRPVQKNKYNSTIVEVGDQDSQYSSSGVRNFDTAVDLSNHEQVVQEYETGSRYEGYKLDGQRDGYGKFFYQDGGYYEGQWKNNKMDGLGKLFYEGGKLAYEGNWCQDQFHGFGKVYNDNPVHLQCGFDFTNFDLLEDYWEYYEGMLVKDTKEGRGKIKLTNGEVFEGDFHNDRIQGFGKFFMKENSMIEGIWRDSKLIKIISS